MSETDAHVVHDDLRCARCGYSLRSLNLAGRCPECGLAIAESQLGDEARAILKREDRILAKMDRYRRNRNGAVVIVIIFCLGLAMLIALPVTTFSNSTGLDLLIFAYFLNLFFWSAVACINHARFQHAQSIAMHRHRRDST